MQVLVGDRDEAFRAEAYAPLLATERPSAPVGVVPGVGHIGLTLEPAAVRAVVDAVRRAQPQSVANH